MLQIRWILEFGPLKCECFRCDVHEDYLDSRLSDWSLGSALSILNDLTSESGEADMDYLEHMGDTIRALLQTGHEDWLLSKLRSFTDPTPGNIVDIVFGTF